MIPNDTVGHRPGGKNCPDGSTATTFAGNPYDPKMKESLPYPINFDTSTPTGKLMQTMLAAVAEFERKMMLERQAEGIRIAKAQGKFKGRKPTAREKSDEVHRLLSDGLTKKAVAEKVGIGVASVYRIAKEAKKGTIGERAVMPYLGEVK